MASKLEIWNLALRRIGQRVVQGESEASEEANTMRNLWDFARDSALEIHDWTFARRYRTSGLLADVVPGWEYTYAWPSDCITPRQLVREDRAFWDLPVDYETCLSEDGSKRVIVTNEESPYLVYTARVIDTSLYAPLYTSALAWLLAAEGIVQLTQDPKRGAPPLASYEDAIAKARGSNLDRHKQTEKPLDPITASRGATRTTPLMRTTRDY